MIYRQATIWDLTDVAKLWHEMVKDIKNIHIERPSPEAFLKDIFDSFDSIATIIYVAVDPQSDKIIGFISGKIAPIPYTVRLSCYGEALYVDKEYRQQGINFKLMELFMDEADKRDKEDSIENIEFDTSYKENPIKAYENMGFKPVKVTWRKEVNRD